MRDAHAAVRQQARDDADVEADDHAVADAEAVWQRVRERRRVHFFAEPSDAHLGAQSSKFQNENAKY